MPAPALCRMITHAAAAFAMEILARDAVNFG